MAELKVRCPSGLRGLGKGLRAAVLADYVLDEHELVLLRQAVRVVDLCDTLQTIVDSDGPVVADTKGSLRTHPAMIELRLQRLVLARLIVALPQGLVRLPGMTSMATSRMKKQIA
jgi:hypothetical protein